METEQESAEQVSLPLDAATMLRAAREAKRVELEHISAETRIPIRHLEAIEAGDFDALPSRTYAIGFSKTYAREVGLDEHEIADLVRADMADSFANSSMIAGGMEPGDPAKLPSAGLAWFGAFAALLLAVGTIAYVSTNYGGAELGSLLADSDDAEDTAAIASAEAEETTPAPDASGQVVFTALEDDVWVRFYEEGGERLLEKQLADGERFVVPQSAVEPRINTGRPDLLAITIDGQSVPKLSEEPTTLGDTPISAAALLARADDTSTLGNTDTASN